MEDRAKILARLADTSRLLELRAALRRGATCASPCAELTTATNLSGASRLGILPGSFNPPTVAHRALARAALDEEVVDVVLLTLSTHTVDKELVSGATLEDRLLLLELLCDADPRLGVLVVNRGLYVEQAELVRRAFPQAVRVAFILGFDKIVQIFDRRYYDDRDAALSRLFDLAEILVAPRDEAGPNELRSLLDRPENRPFRHAVRMLEVPSALRRVSSSAAREGAAAGAELEELPYAARLYVEQTGAYDRSAAGHERYRRRIAELERAEGRARC